MVLHPTKELGKVADTGFVICGSGTSEGGSVGGVAVWADPGNITADDGAYARRSSLGTAADALASEFLHARNFGLSVPAGATIDGVEIQINGYSSSATRRIKDYTIFFVKAGSNVGNDLSDDVTWPADMDYLKTYGGPTELGGVSWTAEDVNAAGFGASLQFTSAGETGDLSAEARMDAVWIKVYYTEGSGGAPGNRMPGWW
jgi:hypothetical protein